MNYPEGAKRNDLRYFLTASKIQGAVHQPGAECLGYCIPQCRPRVGESPLLHCSCPDPGYVEQVTTYRR